MDHCDECGYVYADVPQDQVGARLRALGRAYSDRLAAPDDALRAHPLEGVWSALEYCCHVRDVLRVQRERLALALAEEVPEFASMEREERVERDRYNEQLPSQVAAEVVDAAEALAQEFAALEPAQWERTGIYGWPVRAERTMMWIGRHTVHEGHHHLQDVDRVLHAASPTAAADQEDA
jgi:S-DNA-T family DNA segregation ATPase FtsK/SpoIIIE